MAERVDYQAVVADLKIRRAHLDQLIAGFEALILGQGEPGSTELESVAAGPTLPTAIHADTFFGLSILDASKKFLRMMRRSQQTSAIATALGQGGLKRPDVNVLSSILVRAAKGREITKVGKGMWGLPEWYPKPPKEVDEEGRKRPQSRKATAVRKRVEKVASTKAGTPKALRAARPSDVAWEVLQAAGKPLRGSEVAEQVYARGLQTGRQTVENALNRFVAAGKAKRVGPSTFALAS